MPYGVFNHLPVRDCRGRNARGGWVHRKMDHTATGHKSSLTSRAPIAKHELWCSKPLRWSTRWLNLFWNLNRHILHCPYSSKMTCRRSMRGCVCLKLILTPSSPVQTSLASDSTKFDHDFADNTPRLPCPPYIASAYKRLKNNFCKPYPSQADTRLGAERHLRNDSLIGSSLRVYGMDKIKALRPKFSTPTDVVICLGHFVIKIQYSEKTGQEYNGPSSGQGKQPQGGPGQSRFVR